MRIHILIAAFVIALANTACGGGAEGTSCDKIAEHAVQLLLESNAPEQVRTRTRNDKQGAIDRGKKGCEKLDPPAETRKCFMDSKTLEAYTTCGAELDKKYEREISCRMIAEHAIDLALSDDSTPAASKESMKANREATVKNGMKACQEQVPNGETRRCMQVSKTLEEYTSCTN